MKKFAALLLTLFMAVSLVSCAGNSESAKTSTPDIESSRSGGMSVPESSGVEESKTESQPVQSGEPEESASVSEAEGTKILVAYFSVTGTTEGVAEHIANGLNADLYEIVPEEPYTDADLNYNNNNSRSTLEMKDPSARPAISGSVESMEQYDIVFIGYPIWWGDAPRIVSTFMESYDFSGKTIVPFCTSGGSGVGSSASNLEQLTDGAIWLDGHRLNGGDSQDTVMEWVNGLGFSQATENVPAGIPETEPSRAEVETGVSDTTGAEASGMGNTEGSKILIAYFTYGENAELPSDVDASTTASIQIFNGEVTGNTGVMAHMIAEASGGELFSIRTVEPYPDNYEDTINVGQAEKNNGIYPELSTHIENPGQYDTVFVGFPNWWYGMPMVMYSFFEEYDFGGKTIVPFCTSGGSAFSDAISEIKNLEPEADVLKGLHIGGSSVADAKNRVNEWVESLELNQSVE